jgi:hypothetical protein
LDTRCCAYFLSHEKIEKMDHVDEFGLSDKGSKVVPLHSITYIDWINPTFKSFKHSSYLFTHIFIDLLIRFKNNVIGQSIIILHMFIVVLK